MANELRIADTTGLTYTCELRALDGTLIGLASSLTESGSTGRYYGDITGSAITDTTYDLFFIQNSIIEQAITRHWNGSKLLDLGDVPTAVEVRTEVDSNSTQLAAIVADTNELQTDDVPGLIAALNNISTVEVNTEVDTALADYDGPTNTEMLAAHTTTDALIATAQTDLDIITGADGANLLSATQASIDAIETDTSTTIPATITTAQNDLDIITGASGVNLLTATQASIDAIEVDTSTTIPALIAALASASDIASVVWAYVTRTLTSAGSVSSSVAIANQVTIYKSVSLSYTWSSLSIPATWTAIYFTVKTDKDNDADSDALIQILESNPGGGSDGLLYLNGAAATAAEGSLTVDQGAGTIIATIDDAATSNLSLATGNHYDVKVLLSDGTTQLLVKNGQADIVSTPTLTV